MGVCLYMDTKKVRKNERSTVHLDTRGQSHATANWALVKQKDASLSTPPFEEEDESASM